MVAAAPGKGALRPAVAVAGLAAFIIMLTAIVLLSDKMKLHRLVPLERSPEVLADRASSFIRTLGYSDVPRDRAYGFRQNGNYLRYRVDASYVRLLHMSRGAATRDS